MISILCDCLHKLHVHESRSIVILFLVSSDVQWNNNIIEEKLPCHMFVFTY